MNAITAIHPYKDEGLWVFDDASVGLVREPFVSGADEIIERLVQGIPDAARGFTLLFSASPFPGDQTTLEPRRSTLAATGTTAASWESVGYVRRSSDTSTPLRSASMRSANQRLRDTN